MSMGKWRLFEKRHKKTPPAHKVHPGRRAIMPHRFVELLEQRMLLSVNSVNLVQATSASSNSVQVSPTAATAPAAPTGLTAISGNNQVSLSWTASSGATSYTILYGTVNGSSYNKTVTGITGASDTITGLSNGTPYYFVVDALNSAGVSPNSTQVSATPSAGSGTLNFPSGFASSNGVLKYNGSSYLNGTNLSLTNGYAGENSSIYFETPLNVAGFTTTFEFQLTGSYPLGNGFTFVMQNTGLTALGVGGSGLGYGAAATGGAGGIGESAAVKFDMFGTQGEGNDSTGVYTDGAAPTITNSVDLTNTGFNLRSYDPSTCTLTYNGTTLTETLTDLTTKATVTETYTINIPSIVGGSTAYIGFTGADGSLTSVQDILNWTYSSTSSGPTAPAAPTGLTATAGNGQVALNWNASSGASGYIVSYGTTNGNAYNTVLNGISGTNYTVTGLTAGTPYYFVVAAVNSAGTGANSAQATATPTAAVTAPSAPTGLTATAGNGQVALSWTASTGAAGYTVKYGTTSGSSYTSVLSGITTTSQTITGLTNGTAYYFVVSATNSAGTSANSTQAGATPAGAPVATINFANGFAGASSSLGFNGSAYLNSGELFLANNSAGDNSSIYDSTQQNITSFTTTFEFQITGSWPLGNGFTFVIQDAGPNALGVGGGGLGYGAATTGGAGGIPDSIAVKFDVFSSQGEGDDSTGLYTDGAAPTNVNSIDLTNTGFNLRSYDPSTCTLSYDGTTLTETLTDLTSKATVTETYAVNIPSIIGGNTAWVGFTGSDGALTSTQNILNWTYATAASNITAPAAPTGLMATPGNGQAVLNWSASTGATSYTVSYGTTDGSNYTTVLTGITGTTDTITGLTNGTPYYFVVAAVNSAGTGANSPQATATPSLGVTTPSAPTGLTATAGNGQVALNWTASTGATSYTVSYGTTNGSAYSTVLTGVAGTSDTITSLTNGTTYYFVVSATNSAGTSANSTQTSAAPAAPTASINFASGFTGASNALAFNGEAYLNSGELFLANNSAGDDSSIYDSTQQNIASFTTTFEFQITGSWPLGNGFTFVIQDAGQNALGVGGGGLGYGAATTGGAGGIPDSVAVKFDVFSSQGEGDDSTGLYTDGAAPTNTNSIDLTNTGFNLRSYDPSTCTLSYDGTTLTETLTDLTTKATVTESYVVNIPQIVGGTTAWVGFTGADGALTSTQNIMNWTYASATNTTSSGGAAATPTGLTATAGNGQVALNWTASTGATSYTVSYGTTNGSAYSTVLTGITGTSDTITGLANGTPYYFVVAAVNSSGTSANSSQASATPAAPVANINFANGFTGASSSLGFNGSAYLSAGELFLANNSAGDNSSIYDSTQQNIASFTTTFEFQITGSWPLGNGFTFVIQDAGQNALGVGGGGLGYGAATTGGAGGIPDSVAIKFDVFSSQGEGDDSTGLYTDGAAPTNTNSIDLTNTGFNLRSYDPSTCTLSYDGTTLTETLTDLTTKATVTETYTVNIPQIVGGSTAWVGFTGADGALTSTQNIMNWTYASTTSSTTVPAAPTGLMATGGSGQVALNWTASTGATSYTVSYGTASGSYSTVLTGISGTNDTISGLTNGTPYYFVVAAVNSAGTSANSTEVATTPNATVSIPAAPTGVTAIGGNGQVALSWTASTGATSYTVSYGTTNGSAYSTVLTGITGTSDTITGLTNGTPYYFVVSATNSAGTSASSTQASAVPAAPVTNLNFAGGFTGANSQLAFNGSAYLNSGELFLANNSAGEDSSIYDTTQQNITSFTTTFEFQITGSWPLGNGFTFVIQDAGQNALGVGGGGLGYGAATTGGAGGIPDSVAVKFDVFSSQGEGNDSTGLYTDGAAPTNSNSIDLSNTGFNLRSYDPSTCTLSYDGTTLTETLTDLTTKATVTETYVVNIPQIVGGSTAWVGFTGSDGALTSVQNIMNWTYAYSGPPAVPAGVSATAGNGQVALNWAASTDATSYVVSYGTASGSYSTVLTGISGTSDTITGLTNGTPYYFVVSAVDSTGTSGNSTEVSATPMLPAIPAAPTNLTATAGNGQAALTWTGSTGATGYTISYGTTNGSNYTTVLTGITGSSDTITGLTNGTPYYFVVAASNAGGTSANSAQATATPAAPVVPAAPTNLTATAGNGQVMLNWTASTGATSYTVSYGTTNGSNYATVLTGISATTDTITGLTNGTTYYFVVAAADAVGTSANSAQASAMPVVPIPAAPMGLTATGGSGQVILTWNASTFAASYTVSYGTVSGSYSTVLTGITGLTDTISGLTNSVTYYFVVAAVDASGSSGNSTEVAATPIASAVTINAASGFTGDSSEFYFNGTGSARINGSSLFLTDDNRSERGSAWFDTVQNITTFSTTFEFVINGSWPLGSGFTFTIQNAGPTALGAGGAGLGYGAATTGGAGGIPDSMAIKFNDYSSEGQGDDSTGLYTDGAAPTIGNSIDLTNSGFNMRSEDDSTCTLTYNGTTLTETLTDLTTKATVTEMYTVNIASIVGGPTAYIGFTGGDGDDTSNQSIINWTYTTSPPPVAPAAPTGLTATAANNQVALHWTASTGAGSYIVSYGTTNGSNYSTVLTGITGTSDTITGLTDGVPYYFVVSAVNIAGSSANSTQAAATPLAPPAAPANFTATAGAGQVALNWSASATATSYTISYGTTNGSNYATVLNGVAGTSDTITGLTNGTTYYFVIAAVNSTGPGATSAQASATPISAPLAPAGLSATPASGQVTLSWSASAGAISYTVSYGTTNGGNYTTVLTGITATTDTITGLTNGTAYYFVVSAVNSVGASPNSSQANATPAAPLATVPAGVTATPGDGQVVLNWNASTGATSYTVSYGTTNGSNYTTVLTGISTTTDTITGLTDGTAYYFVVAAVNAVGTSANSSQVAATPAAPLPTVPTGVNAAASDGQVALSWTASTGAVTYTISYGTTNGSAYNTVITGISGTTKTITSLTDGTTYYFVVAAVNATGSSANSSQASARPVAPIAAAPTGLTATAGDGQAALNWTGSTGAVTYTVSYGTTNGSAYNTVITGISGTADTITGLTDGTTYYFVVAAVNTGGTSANSSQASATPEPAAPAAPAGFTATAGNGQVVLNWNASTGAATYTVSYGTQSGTYTTVLTGITGTTDTITGLTNLTPYFFVIAAVNAGGSSGNSPEVTATPTVPAAPITTVNFATGFAGASNLTVNGSAALNGPQLELINNAAFEAASVYDNTPQNVASFSTEFEFSITGTWPIANGFTFVIQNTGLNAIGQSGGGLGYGAASSGGDGGIPDSVAIKFDIFSSEGEGDDSTGLYIDGAAPTIAGSVDLTNSGFDLRSYDPSICQLSYTGTTLTETLTDLITKNSVTEMYTVNIPQIIGSQTALVGFTAGDGSDVSLETIQNWSYASGSAAPVAPANLAGSAANGTANVNWSAVPGAFSYNVKYGTTNGSSYNTVISGILGTNAAITGLTGGQTYYIIVTAVDAFGESIGSNQITITA